MPKLIRFLLLFALCFLSAQVDAQSYYERTKDFYPYSQSYTLAATTSSQNTVVSQPTGSSFTSVQQNAGQGAGYTDVLVYNASAGVAFINFGTSTATATTSSPWFVPSGAIMTLNMGLPATNIAVILGSGTGNVYFAVGEGS